ncbi:MAG: peroxiredoxin [Flavobacteriales bacterium]|jgi:peroxiredoxin (alkyl hydroperoxide reductase subunit C)|nr:peroxiredoxin [Flavobacteriales bacterium]MBK6549824.1 peroxiredoxin [Flavobacteriales bacterium]MBK6883486.1 peroxiredoxin [Flavobacteriales bacterium]MBK7102342.1 peroxiredoxin [Flavobacteriales bacterium]MBK7113081.1 peroxiredoxin [Flavobacteriales bacterium]
MENTSMPRIGDPAPDFEALTTHGPLKFSDYIKDSWTILFSHPADFTPVCTTELSGFAENKEWFAKHNTKLIGESIDSIHSHVAWVQAVREKTGVYMDFPIIADIDMKVAKLYGMLHENASSTAAVRAVFFIDPKGIIRLVMYYPLNVGRNMEEIMRVLEAMQTADANGCAMPLNWKKGDRVILPPPKTLADLDARLNEKGIELIDFYLAKKELA